ncbi:MAG: hypothetical protein H0T89_20290 [Deltaproteobacteria bacterium]|nr:hypothetical protein [Deltaproteobacteria bacterium]
MTIVIALSAVALVLIAFVASRIMARQRPAVREQEPPSLGPHGRPHYVPRRPSNFALPPETIDTLPIDFKKMAEKQVAETAELVPPIDRNVLAALVASGSRTSGEVPHPEKLARGSRSAAPEYVATSDPDAQTMTNHSDVNDGTETSRPAGDLDDDVLTRTKMSPVR